MMPVIPAGLRRLVLLRHAKSARPHGVPDHERPLSGKGRRNAQAAGEWFLGEGPRPDLALCSTAVRARQTWEIVCGVLPPVPTRYEGRLYGSDVEDVLDLARATSDGVRVLVMVGHEPTLSETALALAGHGSDGAALKTLTHKFATNGVAVLRIDGPWRRVEPGAAALETFTVPRA